MNKHRCQDMQEEWDSFEPLLRQKLESLDNMTRQMIAGMEAFSDIRTIRKFVPGKFQQLWEEVAERQEERHGRKWRG